MDIKDTLILSFIAAVLVKDIFSLAHSKEEILPGLHLVLYSEGIQNGLRTLSLSLLINVIKYNSKASRILMVIIEPRK